MQNGLRVGEWVAQWTTADTKIDYEIVDPNGYVDAYGQYFGKLNEVEEYLGKLTRNREKLWKGFSNWPDQSNRSLKMRETSESMRGDLTGVK